MNLININTNSISFLLRENLIKLMLLLFLFHYSDLFQDTFRWNQKHQTEFSSIIEGILSDPYILRVTITFHNYYIHLIQIELKYTY